jgi:hypothetical protein
MPDRYAVERGANYLRVRRELSVRSRLAVLRRRRFPEALLAELEADEAAGKPVVVPRPEWWGRETAAYEAYLEDEQDREDEEYMASLSPDDAQEYLEWCRKEKARKAWLREAGRGAGGMSPRSRAKMWRDVLSLPFEMLGERPLWITLTYPGDFWRWVPDGRALERHRVAFGKRWERGFGEPAVGPWAKEFQLKVGRPHIHLFMRGPEAMSEEDYRGLQALTRLAKDNERRLGKAKGRHWTPPSGGKYGGRTAEEMRRWWSETVTGGADLGHERRGVAVRAVFYAYDDAVARDMRRSRLAAYMAGEISKSRQKVPPEGFGRVGNYFGYWGRAQGFKPVVEGFFVEVDVGEQLVRRMALWYELRQRAKGRPVGRDWRRRRDWQGLTVADVTDEQFGRLLARATAAAVRKRGSGVLGAEPPGEVTGA